MSKLKKNNFLFIILISVVTLIVLVVGAFSLYEDNSSVFDGDGYILETSTKTNKKYYFSANTKYKENVDRDISFKDKESNTVAVSPASFVHYTNGNVAFLQKGALVNLADITSPMVSYYNITDDNIIVKDNDVYTVTSNDKKININSFIGRISDEKYLIAGKDLSIKVPKEEERVSGDYFELLFIEEGIVKIDNKDNSFQVTAQDSYVYVGDNITISLGDGKIYHDSDAKMLLSQITIDNDENINLDVYDKDGAGGSGGDGSGGSGDGEGSGEGDGEGDETGEDGEGESALGEIEGSGGEGTGLDGAGGSSDGKGDGSGSGGSGGAPVDSTNSLKIELIEVEVTSTSISLTMQLNNANLARGNVVATLTNVEKDLSPEKRDISLNNGTFKLFFNSLQPDTNYSFSIDETVIGGETQYFQKFFRTKEFGVILEKAFATDKSLAYSINFDENTDVTKVRLSISSEKANPKEFIIENNDKKKKYYEFMDLKSDTIYFVEIDTVWINGTPYNGNYGIYREDTTLKEEPEIIGNLDVKSDEKEGKFTIKLPEITDNNKSVISYTYKIYRVDQLTADNLDPEPVITPIVKYDTDPLVLDLKEHKGLENGVNYKCKVFVQYHDNEMEREVFTTYSDHFLVRTRPSIEWTLDTTYLNKVTGTIRLVDANGMVPLKGNKFILRFFKHGEEETNENDIIFNFDSKSSYYATIGEKVNALGEKVGTLASNTEYDVMVYGDYYDDTNSDGELELINGEIGSFRITTRKSDNIYFEPLGDNKSNNTDIINFNARLTAPEGSTTPDEITTVTFKLYNGRTINDANLIGIYKINDRNDIKSLFGNTIITNSLFTDVTSNRVGLINSLNKLIAVTGSEDKSLNSEYTVEVTDVYAGQNVKIVVENSKYVFKLTPSYFLDARIASNKGPYVTYKPIYKKDLTEEEYEELVKDVENLDLLNDDTVVGIKLENSLAHNHVEDSFDFKKSVEKVVVDYVICNDTIKPCGDIIKEIVDLGNTDTKDDEEKEEINQAIEAAKKKVKIISVNMENWYRTETQTIWLDSSELEDGRGGHFTRGYNYKVGYNLNFYTKDGTNPVYTNDALYVNTLKTIPRQAPIYTQYISSSDSNGITYRYSFSDVDKAISDKNFYYIVAGSEKHESINNKLVIDGKEHEVTVPLSSNINYSLCYATKNFSDKVEYKVISNYDFETEYNYDKKVAYTIDKTLKNNVLRLRLEDNDVTNRAQVYRVVIKAKDSSKNISDYTRYFIASQLATLSIPTGEVDGEGNPIEVKYKYIDIDYANISKFIGTDILVTVYSYYNSGLVGVDQKFDNGMILYNYTDKKYLNIYNGGSDVTNSEVREENFNMGIYYLKENYIYGNSNIYIYNKLLLLERDGKNNNAIVYNPLKGASYYSNNASNIASSVGINFGVSVNQETVDQTSKSKGILLINPNDGRGYSNYTPVVLKEAELVTDDNSYKFDSITPSIEVVTNRENTINSVHIEINPTGIYSNNYNEVEVDVFEDEACEKKIETLRSDIHIEKDGNTGYSATIDDIDYTDLKPDTTYYFKVFAYIDNERVQLYDSATKTAYVTKTYNISTLSAKEIYQNIKFDIKPVGYEEDGSSKKMLTWRIGLNNTLNYKLRFELYEPNINVSGEFKPVKFDGVGDGFDKCDSSINGTSGNNYVTSNGCYISIAKEDVSSISNEEKTYEFSGDSFIFGGNYYKIIVRAIPYTNGKYDEENNLIIYQNDSLTTSKPSISNQMAAITIPIIELPKVGIGELFAGYKCNDWKYNSEDRNMACLDSDQYYFVSYTSSIKDDFKAIRNGKYTVSLLNDKLEKLDSCRYFINYNDNDNNQDKNINGGGCSVTMNVNDGNQKIRFANLDSNTMYYIEVSYNVFRNNFGFSDNEKTEVIPYTDFVYTPIANNTLGNITAGQATSKSVTLTYNGATNLSEIVTRVEYTIRSKSGDVISGEFKRDENNHIFEYVADRTPRLKIEISDSSFSFRENESYVINTSYYYVVDINGDGKPDDVNGDGEPDELKVINQYTGSGTYTSNLNL